MTVKWLLSERWQGRPLSVNSPYRELTVGCRSKDAGSEGSTVKCTSGCLCLPHAREVHAQIGQVIASHRLNLRWLRAWGCILKPPKLSAAS